MQHVKTILSQILNVPHSEIKSLAPLKAGMTNNSYRFICKGESLILRIPGKGTEKLIDRKNEAHTYHVINGKNICDNVKYFDPKTGYKISEFLEPVRTCNPQNPHDLTACMEKLESFHALNFQVPYEFNLWRQIEFYESLLTGKTSFHNDYQRTKENVFSLRTFIEENIQHKTLSHIDSIHDNFLFVKKTDGSEDLRLIDWEYSGMQDPHVDLAMFCIYAAYGKTQTDDLIDIYFHGNCPRVLRIKIYAYMAVCGLLWNNWCEYKQSLGIHFGEYAERQYRYAKNFFELVKREIEK